MIKGALEIGTPSETMIEGTLEIETPTVTIIEAALEKSVRNRDTIRDHDRRSVRK